MGKGVSWHGEQKKKKKRKQQKKNLFFFLLSTCRGGIANSFTAAIYKYCRGYLETLDNLGNVFASFHGWSF